MKRTDVDGNENRHASVKFIIQKCYSFFGLLHWWEYQESFDTIEEARDNLCYFDGSSPKYKVVE